MDAAMTEGEARRLAVEWIYTRPHSADPERGPAKAMQDLRRLYGHTPSKGGKARRWRWADVYDLMWPLLLDSPTYAGRIRRAVAAADRRGLARETGRAVA